MKRNTVIDSLRGLMLVIMTIDHSGSALSHVTGQSFGFISAAEGFVFLSGYVAGIVYSRYLDQPVWLREKAFSRARLLFIYHIIALLLWKIILYQVLQPNLNIDSHAVKAYLLAPFLLYQPVYFDILPMYILFLLLTPMLLTQFSRGNMGTIFAFSLAFWTLAQFVNEAELHFHSTFGVHTKLGYFDPFAWQFLFILGLFLGYLKRQHDYNIVVRRRFWILLLTAAVAFFLLVRHNLIDVPFIDHHAIQKNYTNLDWPRLANFILFALFLSAIVRRFPHWFDFKWLAFLGRHSLQVFTFHIFAVTFAMRQLPDIRATHGIEGDILFTSLVVLSLSIPALIHRAYQQHQKNAS